MLWSCCYGFIKIMCSLTKSVTHQLLLLPLFQCVVAVGKGDELLSPKAIQEAQILKKNPRWRMACKTVVGHGMTEGQMTIQVNPRQWEQV